MAECPSGRPCEGMEWDSRDLMFPGQPSTASSIELTEERHGFLTVVRAARYDRVIMDPSLSEEGTIQLLPNGQRVYPSNLRYLMTMTEEEHVELLAFVKEALTDGWWGGLEEGWCHFTPEEREQCGCAQTTRIATDQMAKDRLTEGFIGDYANDLAGELRFMRGWCPHQPYDHEGVPV